MEKIDDSVLLNLEFSMVVFMPKAIKFTILIAEMIRCTMIHKKAKGGKENLFDLVNWTSPSKL